MYAPLARALNITHVNHAKTITPCGALEGLVLLLEELPDDESHSIADGQGEDVLGHDDPFIEIGVIIAHVNSAAEKDNRSRL